VQERGQLSEKQRGEGRAKYKRSRRASSAKRKSVGTVDGWWSDTGDSDKGSKNKKREK